MADVQHSALTGSDLHESKGADAASANTVNTANGAGGSAWQKVTTDMINTSSIFNVNGFTLTCYIPDLSTASDHYIPVPFGATLTAAYSTLGAAISTANTTLTFKNNGGSTAGTITIAFSGSAAGDVDSTTFSSNNTFTAGQRLKIENDGGGTNTATGYVVLVFTRTA